MILMILMMILNIMIVSPFVRLYVFLSKFVAGVVYEIEDGR